MQSTSVESQEGHAGAVLVINCGSSSVKFALLDAQTEQVLLTGMVEKLGTAETSLSWKQQGNKQTKALPEASLLESLQEVLAVLPAQVPVLAVGHRVVHGGESFAQSVLVTPQVIAELQALSALAPLHNPVNIAGIEAAQRIFPDLPQVAVFDTAFHQTLPQHAFIYGVPMDWYREHGVRRYGFHGTSHRFVAGETARRLRKPLSELSCIIAHLGNGCSTCAIEAGKSVDTSMGISPLEGLVMGTRSGDIDPSLHEFIAQAKGWDLARVMCALNKESGLFGLSGKSNDMRTLVQAAAEGDERAALAIEVFAYRLAKSILSMGAGLSQLDALVFTGGIGENSPLVRAMTIQHLRLLQLRLDEGCNARNGVESAGRISAAEALPCLVIPTNEELMIARETLQLL